MKKRINRRTDAWRNGCVGKMDDYPVNSTPSHHHPKCGNLPKTFLHIILAANVCPPTRAGNSLIRSFLVSDLSDFLMVAHFWWATWAIRLHRSLKKREWANRSCFFLNVQKTYQKYDFSQIFLSELLIRSFIMSDLSKSLFWHEKLERFAYMSWAIWANHSQSLIWFERSERMSDERIPSPAPNQQRQPWPSLLCVLILHNLQYVRVWSLLTRMCNMCIFKYVFQFKEIPSILIQKETKHSRVYIFRLTPYLTFLNWILLYEFRH